ncbi:MAG: hypothetical protein N2255_04285 [Kiritimatiellae bacterium]|nr:hypothetical protein [Kiritimatiellia bacterium]
MTTDWDIKSRSSFCQACGQRFHDRQIYHSALTFDAQGYRRTDFCAACWARLSGNVSVHSKWRGVFREPPPKPVEPVQKETVETLLRRLVEKGDEEKGAVVYILAVMLERKRVLVERDVRKEASGRLVRVYEHRKTGETFVICDPCLQFGQLEEVQQEVAEMLASARRTESSGTDQACDPAVLGTRERPG